MEMERTFNPCASGSKPPASSICKQCSAPLLGKDQKIFCSRSCSTTYYNNLRWPKRACLFCNKLHRNPQYCSVSCARKDSAQPLTPERIEQLRVNNLNAVRKYQAKKLAQLPDDADLEKIKEIYANCPDGYEVDHIIPISKGGLHHQDNLQYLPKLENRRKSNKLDYTPLVQW